MAESETETRSKGILLFGTAVLAGLLIVGVFFARARINHDRDRQICTRVNALYDVLEKEHRTKYGRLQVYFHKHPEGTDGISRDDILNSIRDERDTLEGLSKRCVT